MCRKAFKRNEHLARHMIIHSGRKNQICTECGKAFYRKDHLKKHLQSHNAKPRTPCGQIKRNNDGIINLNNNHFAMIMRQGGPPPFAILRT